MFVLPRSVTKSGREHAVPFNGMASEILDTIPRFNLTTLLFPGRDGEKPWNGWSKAKENLELLPPIRPWTLHDLRRTFATGWAKLGIPPHICEKMLNHATGSLGGVAGVYNRFLYLEERRAAQTKWEQHLRELLAR